MTDQDLLEHALNNLPDAYESVVMKLEDKLGNASDPLTISKLRDELNLKFERMNGKRTIDSNTNDEGETALFAGGFKGKCNKCGRYGHKAKDCRSNSNGNSSGNNNNNGSRKFNGECHYCGKKGHMKKDCFKKKCDDEERKRNEQANVGTDNDNEEMVFMAFDYPWCCETHKHKKKRLLQRTKQRRKTRNDFEKGKTDHR